MRCGHGSIPDSVQEIAGSPNTATAISISSRSTPLSSPRSTSSVSPLPINNAQDQYVWSGIGRHLNQDDPSSDSEVAEEVVRSPTPPSASSNEASRPSSAATDRSAFPSSSTTLPVLESLEESSTWTRKRLRQKSRQAVAIRLEHPTEAQQVGSNTGREKKRKLSTCHRLSPVPDRTGRKPLEVLINQIGQNMMVDIQELARKLETRSYNVRKPVRYLPSRTPIHIDTPAARIIDAVPHLAREIEDSTLNEQLSRVQHRIALADFYYAYRAAHAQPHTFLKGLDRHPSQHIHQAQPRNRNKHTEVKERFIELVFGQSTSQDDRRKHSTYVNNWQKAGRPWFELIKRFGPGILLLMPEGVTNCRQVSYQHS